MSRLFSFFIGCTFLVITGFYVVYEMITFKGNSDGSSKKS
jgi:hypothetical protein